MHTRYSSITAGLLAMILMQLTGAAQTPAQQLSLGDALREAMQRHPALLAADAAVDAERGRKLQALSPPQPELTYHEEEIPAGSPLGSGNQTVFQVSQGFDIPLLTGVRGRLPGSLQESAAHRRNFTRGRVRAEVITAYALFFAREWQLRILQRNHDLYVEFADRAEKRYRAGEASALESARARAEKAAAGIALEAGRQERFTAITGLASALGRALPPEIVPGDSLVAQPLRMDEGGPAFEDHPLLLAAREQAAGYRADAAWRWMLYLPGFSASWFRQEFMDIGLHWGAELTAQVPLWFMLDTRGKNTEADALARQAEAELQQTRAVLESRYGSARQAMESAERAMRAYNADVLREATDIVRAARASYDAGEIDYVEYISAQQSANRTWLGYFDTLAAWYAAAADYELTTGTTILAIGQ